MFKKFVKKHSIYLDYERKFITFDKKFDMETKSVFKILILLPAIIFIDYLVMVLLGCATCLFGFGSDFYCGTYCTLGKIILLISAVLFFFLIFPDIRKMIYRIKNATSQEKQENL